MRQRECFFSPRHDENVCFYPPGQACATFKPSRTVLSDTKNLLFRQHPQLSASINYHVFLLLMLQSPSPVLSFVAFLHCSAFPAPHLVQVGVCPSSSSSQGG